MRTRLALGGIAVAVTLGALPATEAVAGPECARGFEAVCDVLCRLAKPPC
jgi:hypothetical protein